jgi:hypothetical protein
MRVPTERRVLAVLQPGYLPWLGYFDQANRADVFVHYDDVQYDKHGWRNRNRVKSTQGAPHWLSVPVLRSGKDWPKVMDVEIDQRSNWPRKHLGTLQQFYGKAPFFQRYFPEVEKVLTAPYTKLVDLNLALTASLFACLGLERETARSSALDIPGEKTDRLISLCRHFKATHYLTGDAARDYLDTGAFERAGVKVVWQEYQHPEYPQGAPPFVPYLSIIDLLLNCGPESLQILAAGGRRIEDFPT